MRPIDTIIIHCSATRPSEDVDAAEIRRWHMQDNGWSDIGYHLVIGRDGLVEPGRPFQRTGAHVRGHNRYSLGICLIGGHGASANDLFDDHFTPEQRIALGATLHGLRGWLQQAMIKGHNEFANKGCPGFQVSKFCVEMGL